MPAPNRIGMSDAEYVRRLLREIALLDRENATLRGRVDRAERQLVYMQQHYIPRAVLGRVGGARA